MTDSTFNRIFNLVEGILVVALFTCIAMLGAEPSHDTPMVTFVAWVASWGSLMTVVGCALWYMHSLEQRAKASVTEG